MEYNDLPLVERLHFNIDLRNRALWQVMKRFDCTEFGFDGFVFYRRDDTESVDLAGTHEAFHKLVNGEKGE